MAYFSKALSRKPRFFSACARELLELASVEKWLQYLLGNRFEVHTDQESLKYLWEQQQKWPVKLMVFLFCCCRGVGALSRKVEGSDLDNSVNIKLFRISIVVPQWIKNVKEEMATNMCLKELIQKRLDEQLSTKWSVKDGVLFFRNKIYLDKTSELIPVILSEMHSSSHEGNEKTIKRSSKYSFGHK